MAYLLILKSLVLFLWQLHVSADNGKCPSSFECGFLGSIQFPFTTTEQPHCGLLAIHGCEGNNDPYAPKTVKLRNSTSSTSYGVLRVEPRSIVINDDEQEQHVRSNSCRAFSKNLTLPLTSPIASFTIKYNIIIYRCNHSLKVNLPQHFFKYSNCSENNIYYGFPNTEISEGSKRQSRLGTCSTVQLAVQGNFTDNPFQFLSGYTTIEVLLSDACERCIQNGKGQCLLDSKAQFYCAKSGGEETPDASVKGSKGWVVKTVLGLGLGASVALLLIMVKIYCTRWKKQNPTNQRIDIFLKRQGHLQTKRYGYSEIKKVTNSFRNKLGQGGFGSVYKGKLLDGRYVAVKILNEFKENGEEFINEVASISRTSHVNIVTLLGFCYEGSKRALVYEFMSNGSLEKFIFEENTLMTTDRQLDCETLYHIAIGVARGLEYLHKGCNARILHFDIKPHNILLDENFNPKISDFGLAKIYTRKESMVSIFGARGTAGYIAPEVFSRNFGAVSHKSDVYSYGMMVLEMIGGRKINKNEVDPSNEVYFPDWIYNRLESNQELGLHNIRNESDDKLVRKMTIVGLWCIQTRPSTRPAISKVVEMLENKVELLNIPPKPFFSSPSDSPAHLSFETL